jgi:hypothetical protein
MWSEIVLCVIIIIFGDNDVNKNLIKENDEDLY